MGRAWLFAAVLLAGCASSESELRQNSWESLDFAIGQEPGAVVGRLSEAAIRCFDGKRIGLARTFVHRDLREGGGAVITVFQLGLFDPNLLSQIEVTPDGGGAKVHFYRSGGLLSPGAVAPYVQRWADGEVACPGVF